MPDKDGRLTPEEMSAVQGGNSRMVLSGNEQLPEQVIAAYGDFTERTGQALQADMQTFMLHTEQARTMAELSLALAAPVSSGSDGHITWSTSVNNGSHTYETLAKAVGVEATKIGTGDAVISKAQVDHIRSVVDAKLSASQDFATHMQLKIQQSVQSYHSVIGTGRDLLSSSSSLSDFVKIRR